MLFCDACQRPFTLSPDRWRCDCGAPLRWLPSATFSPDAIRSRDGTLWRYQTMLSLPEGAHLVSLGEGMTPLLPTPDGQSWLKLEFLNPTGSFKDRGACVLITGLKAWGVQEVAEDSSGNAGVALSAYAQAAGIRCRIFVPKTASPGKLAALKRFGADIVLCADRQEAAERVMEAVREGTYYASHTWHPLYLQGTKTVAYELAEQLCERLDDTFSVFVPVGNGDLLLGLHLGFQELAMAGQIDSVPLLMAVQAENCAPIYAAAKGVDLPIGTTMAEGVAVANPPRLRQVIAAVTQTKGDILAIPEPAIAEAVDELAALGLWLEPTGALAWAAWQQKGCPPKSILLLTGAGWKTLRP
ncbi:MAG: pyridoxal-phosphate dependent enzyme [Armatimonadota bacterium]|nr:pyridoxal-phosphate dependent enzyme [Armatimonadota bacterium]MDT7971280.1 pyridoxal-phosphate dependent enzyme [Armatimonadota bacterium]